MSFSLILAIYGAILSSFLGLLTILRFIREQRFLVVSVDMQDDEDGEVFFVCWLMNQGSSSITIREIWQGTGLELPRFSFKRLGLSRFSFLRPKIVEAISMSSSESLEYGSDEEALTLAPGEAKKILIKKNDLDKAWQWNQEIDCKTGVERDARTAYLHCLEILHSRSSKEICIALRPRYTSWMPADEHWRPITCQRGNRAEL